MNMVGSITTTGNRQTLRKRAGTAVFALLLAVGTVTHAWAQVDAKSQELYEQAKTLLEQGDVNAAVIQFKNAIKADPDNFEARYALGQIYLQTGEGESAEKEFRAALSRGIEPGRVTLPLASALLSQQQPQKLLDDIDPSETSGDDRARTHVARADAHLILGQLDEAEDEVKKALAVSETIPEPFLAYSTILQRKGDVGSAETQLDKALVVAPELAEALFRKGQLKRAQGNPTDALPYFDRAIEKSPRDIRMRINRAITYIALDQDDKAESDIEAVFELSADNALAKYTRALILSRKQEFEPALELLLSARGIESYPPALYLFASLYFVQSQPATARTYIDRFLVEQPQNDAARLLQASIQLQQDETDPAIRTLEDLNQRLPDNYSVMSLLAGAYLRVDRFDEAAVLYDKAVALQPENEQLALRLVQSQFGAGEIEGAISQLETVIAQNPESASAYALLILGQARSGDFDKATAAAEELKQKLPNSGLPYNFLAALELAQGNQAEARANLEQALEVQDDFVPAILNLARLDRSDGAFDAARQRYEDIVQIDPINLQALIGLAELDFAAGDTDAAFSRLDQATDGNPMAAQPRVLKVNALIQQQRPDQALNTARSLVGDLPNDPSAVDALARAQFANGEVASAQITYRTLTTLTPKSVDAYIRLATVETELNNLTDAAASYDRAIELEPASVVARNGRIDLERRMNGGDAAVTMAEAMSTQIEDSVQGQLFIADAHFRNENYPASIELYQSAFNERQERAVYLQLYRSLEAANRIDDARELVTNWLAENEDDNQSRFILSGIHIRNGNYEDAITESARILESAPEDPAVMNNLAWLYDQTGESAKALELAEKAYELQPNSPEISDTLGWLVFRQGDQTRALPLLAAAQNARPENAEIGYHYAAALNAAGRPAEAKTILETVISSGQTFDQMDEAKTLYESLN